MGGEVLNQLHLGRVVYALFSSIFIANLLFTTLLEIKIQTKNRKKTEFEYESGKRRGSTKLPFR
jgi:hypothetical protein